VTKTRGASDRGAIDRGAIGLSPFCPVALRSDTSQCIPATVPDLPLFRLFCRAGSHKLKIPHSEK